MLSPNELKLSSAKGHALLGASNYLTMVRYWYYGDEPHELFCKAEANEAPGGSSRKRKPARMVAEKIMQ